jgi:hypothetical protein
MKKNRAMNSISMGISWPANPFPWKNVVQKKNKQKQLGK